MAAVTPDSRLEPTEILQAIEDYQEETGVLLSIEEYLNVSKNTDKPNDAPEPTNAEDIGNLPQLNARSPATIGILFIDVNFHAHCTEQSVLLKEANASNLYWIAMMLGEFGTLPSFEDVFEIAPGVASNPDEFVFNRELHPAGYTRNDDSRGITGKQYANILRNAEFIQKNTLVINLLKGAGYSADDLTQEQMYQDLDTKQRLRNSTNKTNDDNKAVAAKVRMRNAAKSVDCGV
jgi:hypothetical protein